MVCFHYPSKLFVALRSKSLIYNPGLSVCLLFIALLCSCSRGATIRGFDGALWRTDQNGCAGKRLALLKDLEPNLEQLKGLKNQEVIKVLGKPDRNELYKRNQKFFIYHVSASEDCTNHNRGTSTIYLSIRFNALGLSSEAVIYR